MTIVGKRLRRRRLESDMKRMTLEESLKGHRLLKVTLKNEVVTFETDRAVVEWDTEGNCCSQSWIEAIDFGGLENAFVTSVVEAELPNSWYIRNPGPGESDHLTLYGIEVNTDRGVGVVDFRNESNGYYGGMAYVRSYRAR